MQKKLEKSLVGTSGVFFASAELARRGWVAMPTIRNTAGIDIIATKKGKTVNIQVKTNGYGKIKYPLGEHNETEIDNTLYYVFVTLRDDNHRPDYFIIPSGLVAEYIRRTHKHWTSLPPRQRRAIYQGASAETIRAKREKSDIRQFPNYIGNLLPEYKDFSIENYRDGWFRLES